jgi:hypothetical protein
MNTDLIAKLKLITQTAMARGGLNSGDYSYIMTALYYRDAGKAVEAMKLVPALADDLECIGATPAA